MSDARSSWRCPRMNPSTNRFDPYRSFRFRVKWDGQYVAGLSKMGALKRTPAQAQAEFMEQMKARQAQAAAGAGPPETPPAGGNGGDQPDGDGAAVRPAARPGSGPEPRPCLRLRAPC